jgi:hypothetical protein
LSQRRKNFDFISSKMGAIKLAWDGVFFPGRYGHGKPTKPINTAFLALHNLQSYIISVCF